MNNGIQIIYTFVILSTLAVASIVFSKVSNNSKLLAVVLLYLSITVFIAVTKLSWANVGLSKEHMLKGALTALPFMLVFVLGAIVVFLINPDIFKDSRYQTDLQTMLTTIFLILPLMTVILEELAFRGLLFGTLSTYLSQSYALLISSVSFGIWHIFSASNISISTIGGHTLSKGLIVISVVLATSVAGAFFTWLRIKSGSLVAPILLHWTVNSTGVILAFFAWRR